ncbi:MAG TPA: LemA family protein [Fibrobacteraceae bacterium]|jgi:LemA protein|nr:LemA family protein [Fibrobacter sp.]HOG67818.1 LemA family protein [Fibrobacteraceae bacterium]
MKKIILIIIAVIAIIGVLVGVRAIGAYNKIIAFDESVKEKWAQVENAYQRRFDLIPNIVASVQGEANFEKSTLTEVVDARSRMGGVVKVDENMLNDEVAMKRFQESQASLGGALQRLLMVTENYPTLQSNKGFQDLRVQLEGAENRISVERKRYNEIVKEYNTLIRQFPTNIIAGFAGATPKIPFAADAAATTAPKVEFK